MLVQGDSKGLTAIPSLRTKKTNRSILILSMLLDGSLTKCKCPLETHENKDGHTMIKNIQPSLEKRKEKKRLGISKNEVLTPLLPRKIFTS
jgi:hypothetical protein